MADVCEILNSFPSEDHCLWQLGGVLLKDGSSHWFNFYLMSPNFGSGLVLSVEIEGEWYGHCSQRALGLVGAGRINRQRGGHEQCFEGKCRQRWELKGAASQWDCKERKPASLRKVLKCLTWISASGKRVQLDCSLASRNVENNLVPVSLPVINFSFDKRRKDLCDRSLFPTCVHLFVSTCKSKKVIPTPGDSRKLAQPPTLSTACAGRSSEFVFHLLRLSCSWESPTTQLIHRFVNLGGFTLSGSKSVADMLHNALFSKVSCLNQGLRSDKNP